MYYYFSDITAQQKQQLQAIVDKYASVKGSYEATMLGGIVHGYCDSGILTDCYSVNDADTVAQYFSEEGQQEGYLELFNNFIKAVTGKDLECVTVINEISDICDIELGAAYIGSKLGMINV
jgi:hypothetical protein